MSRGAVQETVTCLPPEVRHRGPDLKDFGYTGRPLLRDVSGVTGQQVWCGVGMLLLLLPLHQGLNV